MPGFRSKAFLGHTKEELLKDVIHAVRLTKGISMLPTMGAPGAQALKSVLTPA